jgi:hypothetical protein
VLSNVATFLIRSTPQTGQGHHPHSPRHAPTPVCPCGTNHPVVGKTARIVPQGPLLLSGAILSGGW